jgi:hypothetical protein
LGPGGFSLPQAYRSPAFFGRPALPAFFFARAALLMLTF